MDRRAAVAHVLSTAELMGVTLAELVEAAKDDVAMPSVAEFLKRVTEVESSKAMWTTARACIETSSPSSATGRSTA